MHWHQLTSTDHTITVTVSWWVPIVSAAAVVIGVLLFRAAAIGVMPWVFSNTGSGRASRSFSRLAMMPGGFIMIAGAAGIWLWFASDLRLDDQGVYWHQGDRKVKQGTWDRLWQATLSQYGKAGRKFVTLEFFQGDLITFMEDEDVGQDFSKLLDFVVQHVQKVNLKEQQRRLLGGRVVQEQVPKLHQNESRSP